MRVSSIGHQSVIPGRAFRSAEPLPVSSLTSFEGFTSSDVSDEVGALYTMDGCIRPLAAAMPRMLGTAVTVRAVPGDNWAIHAGLSLCGAGHVLVIDWRGYTGGCGSGALSLAPAIERGLVGVVIDGAWRDVPDLDAAGFPVFGRATNPYSPPKRQLGEINVPAHCAGVVVHPGDLIFGDEEGVVVVPRTEVETVAASLAAKRNQPSLPAESHERVTRIGRLFWEEFGVVPQDLPSLPQ